MDSDKLDEVDALRFEVRQLRRALAELNLEHEALLLDIEKKALATKYTLAEGDNVDIAGRAIRRANGSKPATVYQPQ